MAKNDQLPPNFEIMRWVKKKFLAQNDDGEVEVDSDGMPTFVFPNAFELREGEEYLSVTCLDLFEGVGMDRISATVRGFKATLTGEKKFPNLALS